MLYLIAIITMAIDHIGLIFFPSCAVLRIIGRIAFPVFAYGIALGQKRTKDKVKYFLGLLVLGLISQCLFFLLFEKTVFNVVLTFVLALAIINVVEKNIFILFSVVPFALVVVRFFEYGLYGLLVVLAYYYFFEKKGVCVVLLLLISLLYLSLPQAYAVVPLVSLLFVKFSPYTLS